MPRKLKVYQTSQGFYDLAIAVPSMKAALEAWGAGSNLFHQGFAREVDDAKTVAATLAKPGTVLKRPVGTNKPFAEESDLPTDLDLNKHPSKTKVAAKASKKSARKPPATKGDDKKAKAAALAYEKAQREREAERRKQEAADAKDRKRREKALEKAQAAYDKAEQNHEARANALQDERADLEKRIQAEDSRWDDLRDRLRDAVRDAGG